MIDSLRTLCLDERPEAAELVRGLHLASHGTACEIDTVRMLELYCRFVHENESWMARLARGLADVSVLGLPADAEEVTVEKLQKIPARRRNLKGTK